jgi:tetratricopeptide (TPR) repeat protein
MAYARLGENASSEKYLKKALRTAPDSAAANFNMGLLKAEQNDLKGAEKYLKAALKADPQMAQAAYNLCVITAKDRINEAISWCRKAAKLSPEEPRYAFTLAFYLNQKGDRDETLRILDAVIEKHPQYKDALILRDQITAQKKQPQ